MCLALSVLATFDTLYRYASAVGLHIRLTADPGDETVSLEEAAASRSQARDAGGNEASAESKRGKVVRPSTNKTVDIIRPASPSRLPRSR
jgi:hypothetical protein